MNTNIKNIFEISNKYISHLHPFFLPIDPQILAILDQFSQARWQKLLDCSNVPRIFQKLCALSLFLKYDALYDDPCRLENAMTET